MAAGKMGKFKRDCNRTVTTERSIRFAGTHEDRHSNGKRREIHERMYAAMRDMDRRGKLPVYVDGCYILTNPRKVKEALEETKRFNREFTTEHLKVHTLKILMDGTLKIETAAMITPYVDTGLSGATPFNAQELAEILKELNKEDLKRILTEPKNAITKQFKASFAIDDLDLTFTDDALEEIAGIAIKQKTGARGLRAIVEKMLMDLMYEAPSIKGKKKLEVTKEMVEQKESIDFTKLLSEQKSA
jgi:hypothetical protein